MSPLLQEQLRGSEKITRPLLLGHPSEEKNILFLLIVRPLPTSRAKTLYIDTVVNNLNAFFRSADLGDENFLGMMGNCNCSCSPFNRYLLQVHDCWVRTTATGSIILCRMNGQDKRRVEPQRHGKARHCAHPIVSVDKIYPRG